MNANARMRERVAGLRTVNNVREALRWANNWEVEALGLGNSRYAPTTRNEWAAHERYKAMLGRRLLALQAAQRNRPRRRVRAAKVIQRKFRQAYYAPNAGHGLRGRGYRKTMARLRGRQASPPASPRSRITATLRAKLANLRAAQNSGNRGNMVNIYNSMGRAWEAAGGIHGANVMNNAQRVMFRAGLI